MQSHNPTRRTKQLKQSLALTPRPSNRLSETRDTHLDVEVPRKDSLTHARHPQWVVAQPDALRGAMLVALIVVTIVLYLVLWELEQSSFSSVQNPNLARNVVTASPSSRSSGTRWEAGDRAMPTEEPGRAKPNKWPPPITRLPDELDSKRLTAAEVDEHSRQDDITKLSSYDSMYCNGTCRFLLPVRVGEQESKARDHFIQLLVLAKQLNRTIVLPNVGKSRLSACAEWSFDAYYDTSGLARRDNAPSTWPAIDFERFARWVDERPVLPSSFSVSMKTMPRGRRDILGVQSIPEGIPFIIEKSDVNSKTLTCLESKLTRLRSSLPEMALSVSFDSGSLRTEVDTSSHLLQLLSGNIDMDADPDFGFDLTTVPGYDEYDPYQYTNASHLSLTDMDVLVLDYDLRYPLFTASTQAGFNLHYAPVLYDLAERLADNLGPFLGVHWRMENVPVQNLAWCAASLVSTLHALLEDDATGKNVQHVWLATDHPRPLSTFTNDARFPAGYKWPLNSGASHTESRSPLQRYSPSRKSSTFKHLSSEHDDAIEMLVGAFQSGGELDEWTLTDLAEQLQRYPYVEGRLDVNDSLLGDPGVLGILDKLVVVQARAFVSGSADCSKTSSFSKQVIEARQETYRSERGAGVIRDVVEYFGKW